MQIRTPWSSHCRFAQEKSFRYNKMLAVATEGYFSLFHGQKCVLRISWQEVRDITVETQKHKNMVSIHLYDDRSIDLLFSSRNWLGLNSPEVAVDAGNELRWINYQRQYV